MAIIVYPNDYSYQLKIITDPSDKKPVVFTVSPLSHDVKSKIMHETTEIVQGKIVIDHSKSNFLCLKHSLKDVDGIQDHLGKKWKLQFDEDGTINDGCLNSLLNAPIQSKLAFAAMQMLGNIPTEVVNPTTGEVIKGIKVVHPKAPKDPSKKKK